MDIASDNHDDCANNKNSKREMQLLCEIAMNMDDQVKHFAFKRKQTDRVSDRVRFFWKELRSS